MVNGELLVMVGVSGNVSTAITFMLEGLQTHLTKMSVEFAPLDVDQLRIEFSEENSAPDCVVIVSEDCCSEHVVHQMFWREYLKYFPAVPVITVTMGCDCKQPVPDHELASHYKTDAAGVNHTTLLAAHIRQRLAPKSA